jgi:hypothetical protein
MVFAQGIMHRCPGGKAYAAGYCNENSQWLSATGYLADQITEVT